MLLDIASLSAAPKIDYRIVGEHPHRSSIFTQGLAMDDQWFYESGGGYGRSSLSLIRRSDLSVQRQIALPKFLFAEGLTVVGDQLYLLTWQAGKCLIFDRQSLHQRRIVHYQGEGWGLASNGNVLVMSDGSDVLRFRNTHTFAVQRKIRVRDNGESVYRLNELEWMDNYILANVWHSERIALIVPTNGEVIGWLDVARLRARMPAGQKELNGIAWDKMKRELWVTGKNWPRMFVLKLLTVPALQH